MKKSILFVLTSIAVTFSKYSNAQFNWFAASGTTTAITDIHICDDTTYSVYMFNPTATPVTNGILDIQLPASIEYIAGSVVIEGASVAVTESNIANLNHPFFSVATIPANGGVMIFKYRVKALCGGAANSVQVPITLTYDNNLTSSPNAQGGGLNGININSPAINIVSATNQNFIGNVGDSYTQTLTVRNAGLGHLRLDRANGGNFARILLDSTSCLTISNPSIGTLSGDTLIIPLNAISASLTGDADQLWENNEDLIITYNVTINCCADLTRGMTPQWGCDATICNTGSTFNSNVIINNVTPNIAVAFPNVVKASYCMKGEVVTERLRVVNTGLGSATNISIVISNLIPGSISGQNEFDTSGVWVIYDKNNNPIGNVTKVGSMAGGNDAQSNCHGGQSYPAVVSLALPSLAPNDTVYIDVKVKAPNLNWAAGCHNCPSFGVFALNRNSIAYQNACGTANYSFVNGGLQNFGYAIEYGATLEMPTDLQDGQVFEAVYSNSEHHHSTKSDANGRVYYTLVVPPGFTVNGDVYKTYTSNGTYTVGTKDTLTPFQIGDTIFVPFNHNIGETGAFSLKMSITASCAFGGGSKTFSFATRIYWDSLCANPTYTKYGCGTSTTVLHCGNCPHGGATPVAYNLERVSFGQGDADNNTYPDGLLDTSLVDKHHALPGDTLKSTWNINVGLSASGVAADGGLPFPHVYVDAWFPTIAGDTILSIDGATAYVYNRATGVLVNTCSGINPVTIAGTGNTEAYRYDLSNCKGALWTNNDSIVFEAFHYIKAIQVYNSSAFRDDLVTSHNVFASYTANPSTTYGDIYSAANPTGTKFTCDAYNNYMKIYNLHVSPHIPSGQVVNGCGSVVQYHARLYTEIQSNETRFPNEYRWSAVADSVRILIPQGLTPNINNIQISHNFSSPNPANIVLNAANNVGISGPYLILRNLKSFYVPFGGATPLAETYQVVFHVPYLPTCNSISETPLASSAAFYFAGNPAHYPAPFASWTNNTYTNDSSATTVVYKGPQPLMTGGGIVNITSDSVTWNLTRQNLSNAIDANNSWMYLTTLQGTPLTNLTVKQGATVIAPDANGFYQLGTNLKSSSVNYTVNGDAANCDTVKYLVLSGWGCSGYPVSINTPNLCFESDTLVAIPLPAGTDANLTVINNNGNTSNFCAPIDVEITLNSTQLGDVSNLTLGNVLPFGFSYVPNSLQVQYPINTPYRTPSNPGGGINFIGQIMQIDINALDSLLGYGLSGSYDANKKTTKLKFQMSTQCGAASGDVMACVFNSVSACGTNLPVIVKESTPVVFTEAVIPNYTTTATGAADTVLGCSVATVYDLDINLAINQITGGTSSADSIYITFPPGAVFNSYNPLAAGQINQPAVQPAGPVDVGNGQLRYSFPMTGGLTGGNIQFSMKYTFDYAQYTCGQLLSSFIIASGVDTAVICNGDTCSLTSISGRGTAPMTVKMPSLQASIQTPKCTYYPLNGNTITNPFDVLILNSGNLDVPAGTMTLVDIYCDADNSGTLTAGDSPLQQLNTSNAIPAGGSTTISNVIITYTNVNCPPGKLLAKVSRMPVIGAEQCVCEQPEINFVCSATPVPVILTSFTGIGQEAANRLDWNVTSETFFSHYELERSTNNTNSFVKIGEVSGKNASVPTAYTQFDTNPHQKEYYRLKMVDIDGQFKYSEIVFIDRSSITSSNLYVYPNPVTNVLNVVLYGNTIDGESVEISVVDMVGRTIITRTEEMLKGLNRFTISTEGLSKGNYILKVKRSESEQYEIVKFAK